MNPASDDPSSRGFTSATPSDPSDGPPGEAATGGAADIPNALIPGVDTDLVWETGQTAQGEEILAYRACGKGYQFFVERRSSGALGFALKSGSECGGKAIVDLNVGQVPVIGEYDVIYLSTKPRLKRITAVARPAKMPLRGSVTTVYRLEWHGDVATSFHSYSFLTKLLGRVAAERLAGLAEARYDCMPELEPGLNRARLAITYPGSEGGAVGRLEAPASRRRGGQPPSDPNLAMTRLAEHASGTAAEITQLQAQMTRLIAAVESLALDGARQAGDVTEGMETGSG